jgi:hypothetical protein
MVCREIKRSWRTRYRLEQSVITRSYDVANAHLFAGLLSDDVVTFSAMASVIVILQLLRHCKTLVDLCILYKDWQPRLIAGLPLFAERCGHQNQSVNRIPTRPL